MTRAVGGRILLVEDDPDLRQMMADLLATEGYDLEVAANGDEALKMLARGPRPHVILLDLMMPVMDGWTFRVRQRADAALADIPVIVVSAAPRDTFAAIEPADALQKPLNFDHMIATVGTCCHARRGAAE